MGHSRVKHPYLTVEASVKVFVYAQAVTKAFAVATLRDDEFVWPALPPNEGLLQNPLAFPNIFEVDVLGEVEPATGSTWDAYLLQRLRTGGADLIDYAAINPPLTYNKQLLIYHLDNLSWKRGEEFIKYLRKLLLNVKAETVDQFEIKEDSQVLLNTVSWLESYAKQYRINHIVKEEESQQKFTGKETVLAYKILLEYGHLDRHEIGNIDDQVAYIANKLNLTIEIVKRYIASNRSRTHNSQYKIYTEDIFLRAIEFIEKEWPAVDTSTFRLRDIINS